MPILILFILNYDELINIFFFCKSKSNILFCYVILKTKLGYELVKYVFTLSNNN